MAAALILPAGIQIDGINDSKKLSEKRRRQLDCEIREKAVSFGIGVADEQEIERYNILQAAFLSMKRAVDALEIKPGYVLVDGRDFPRFVYQGEPLNGEALIKGDSKSAVVAGASILAKVYRDAIMVRYARQYPGYGFEQHKGYGTKMHRDKILEFGPCPIHRKKFLRKILKAENRPPKAVG